MHRKGGKSKVRGAFNRIQKRTESFLSRHFPAILVIAGLGLLSLALGMVAVPLGIGAAGISCLILEWRLTE